MPCSVGTTGERRYLGSGVGSGELIAQKHFRRSSGTRTAGMMLVNPLRRDTVEDPTWLSAASSGEPPPMANNPVRAKVLYEFGVLLYRHRLMDGRTRSAPNSLTKASVPLCPSERPGGKPPRRMLWPPGDDDGLLASLECSFTRGERPHQYRSAWLVNVHKAHPPLTGCHRWWQMPEKTPVPPLMPHLEQL